MDDLQLLIDLHIDGDRQGPGGDDATTQAIALAGLQNLSGLKIADIGCGTGAATLALGRQLDGHITAVDFLPQFLERLEQRAGEAGLAGKITTLAASMDALPFTPNSLDVIWSEGAIYNMGFEAGIKYVHSFLKPGGVLAVSELSWFTNQRPAELHDHWMQAYPEVDTASAKIAQLENNGYSLLGYFPLTRTHWIDNYYRPMQHRFDKLLAKYRQTAESVAVVQAERAEIALYEKYADYFGYGFYIAHKVG